MGLEVDNVFTKVEVLGEQARNFALEGSDAQTLSRVVSGRQLVRL